MMRHRQEIVDDAYLRRLTSPCLHRLKSLVDLNDTEEQFIETLQSDLQSFAMGTQVYREGDAAVRPWVVASGWACQLRMLPDGRRQIISFFLPGDTVGVLDLQHPAAQCTISALTDVEVLNPT